MISVAKTPRDVSEEILRGMDLTKSYVFSCFLCELCTSICPEEIDVAQMFLEAREALALDMLSSSPYVKLLLSDEPNSLINVYRRRKRADYCGAQPTESFRYAFLPGCSMIYLSPKAITKVHAELSEVLGDVGILDVCCGKPMYDFGLKERAVKWLASGVLKELDKHKCDVVIVACPNCYYHLKRMLPRNVEVTTVYEMLGENLSGKIEDLKITIHDSCPDRFNGVFASKVRKILARCTIVEMEHSRSKTMCCGAGGLVAYVNPSLSQSLAYSRIQEALSTQADVLVTYCYTCAGMLSGLQSFIEVKHTLDLLLEVKEPYTVRQEELLKVIAELMSQIKI